MGARIYTRRCCYFNPRSPRGLRPAALRQTVLYVIFQSTQPKRAATGQSYAAAMAQAISIHAAQEGCDSMHLQCWVNWCKFQSTQPKRAATLLKMIEAARQYDFNPRSPRGLRRTCTKLHKITHFNFNPRSPRGLRLL